LHEVIDAAMQFSDRALQGAKFILGDGRDVASMLCEKTPRLPF
jgi:hypothetical protein